MLKRNDALDEIIELVKSDLSAEKFKALLILLDKLDSESRRNVIDYIREEMFP